MTRPHAASAFQSQQLENIVDVSDTKNILGASVFLLHDNFYRNFRERGRGKGRGDDADQLIQHIFTKVSWYNCSTKTF